ncbi:hypothetical protein B0H17DRAFT_1144199 [Mycena rosella]|uniref:Uncharacterized protein n=1 Tax=Mycena rosella TaxID=1033263 RepID=A0AAD7G5X3_MYCRO|nr:hypothetical protein B0H17DRAFT_1144199 [Mycena rosella]
MPRGQPRLDPETKFEHVQDARRHYEEKNAAARRDAARLRMQRHRAVIADSDILTRRKYAQQAAEAADSYRFREAGTQALRKKHNPPAHVSPRLSACKPSASIAQRPIPEPLVAPCHDRAQRCIHCYDECISCACMCPESDEWFEHADGHFFPTCNGCGRECPGCRYAPDAGHENKWTHPGPFYALVCKEWRGAVTSRYTFLFLCVVPPLIHRSKSLQRMLELYPHASTWEAAPYLTFLRMWNLDCAEYHNHEGEVPFKPPASEPLPTPASAAPPPYRPFKAERGNSALKSKKGSPDSVIQPQRDVFQPAGRGTSELSKQELKELGSLIMRLPKKEPGSGALPLTKQELDHLASFRPRPGPISPQRLNQQFVRALEAQAAVPVVPTSAPRPSSPLPSPRRTRPCTPAAAAQAPTSAPRPSSPLPSPRRTRPRTPAAAAQAPSPIESAPRLRTPRQGRGSKVDFQEEGAVEGGALIHNEDKVFDFLAEEARTNMKI